MAKSKLVPVMLTTSHRGVFFGYASPGSDFTAKTIRIENVRMCLTWSTDVKGILGLAATGPSKNCRIGPRVPAMTIPDITSVIETSDAAVEAWESAPWA